MRTEDRARLSLFRRTLVVILAGFGLLAGMMAMHTLVGSHSPIAASPEGVVHVDTGPVPVLLQGLTAGIGADVAGDLACGELCCAVAAACLLVLVLSAIVVLAAFPAVFYRLLDRGSQMAAAWFDARFQPWKPSLTVLSVSRI